MTDHTIHIFDKYAIAYNGWFETHTYAYESELLAVHNLLPQGGDGLEVGVGTGRFASRLGIKIGVEPAHAMALIAQQRGIEAHETVAEALPFADESFDFVLMVTAICFFNDPLQPLQEARRVLKPSGRVVVGMIDKDSPIGKSYEEGRAESMFIEALISTLSCR